MSNLLANFKNLIVFEYHLQKRDDPNDTKTIIANRYNIVLLDSSQSSLSNISMISEKNIGKTATPVIVPFSKSLVYRFEAKNRVLEKQLNKLLKQTPFDLKEDLGKNLQKVQYDLLEWQSLAKKVQILRKKGREAPDEFKEQIRKNTVYLTSEKEKLVKQLEAYKNINKAKKDIQKQIQKIQEDQRIYQDLGKGRRVSGFLKPQDYFAITDSHFPGFQKGKEISKHPNGFKPNDLYKILPQSTQIKASNCNLLMKRI